MEQTTYQILLCPSVGKNSHWLPCVVSGLQTAVDAAQECLRRAPQFELAGIYNSVTKAHAWNVWPEKEGSE